jgi:hypothetical protein
MSQDKSLPKNWRVTYTVAGGETVNLIWPFPEEPTHRQIAALIRSALGPTDYSFPDLPQSKNRAEAAEEFLKLNAMQNLRSVPLW